MNGKGTFGVYRFSLIIIVIRFGGILGHKLSLLLGPASATQSTAINAFCNNGKWALRPSSIQLRLGVDKLRSLKKLFGRLLPFTNRSCINNNKVCAASAACFALSRKEGTKKLPESIQKLQCVKVWGCATVFRVLIERSQRY